MPVIEQSPFNLAWVLLCAALVFTMQAGFTCLESGLVRAKNSINVAIKNAVDFLIASSLFYLFAFGLMFGPSLHGWLGSGAGSMLEQGGPGLAAYFLFQMTFCGTATTIVSGAVAERMRFVGYCICAAMIAGIVYPVVGHWIWGGAIEGTEPGWLRRLGFTDFAGSTVVHSVGGWVALAAVITIGPRIGRFGPAGRPIEGHDLTLATLGMFILWLGWFGFNGGSNLEVDDRLPKIITNTMLAGVFGGLAGLLTAWLITGRPEVPRILNSIISGLVAITASANIATLGGAAVIGFIAGVIAAAGFALLERLRVDDAIGAIPAHLFAGIWGSLAVALFGDPGAFIAPHGRAHQLLIQMLGVTAAGGFAFGTSFVLLNLINRVMPLRVTPEQERLGLNISEHGATTAVFQLLADMDRQRLAGQFTTPVSVEPYSEAGEIAVMYNHVLEKFNAARADLETAFAELRRAEAQAKRGLELIRNELEVARDIQRTMVPASAPPSQPGRPVEIFASMSTAHEVGGDFYDYFWSPDGMMWCVIGDVADKGMSAALTMARCVSLIHVTASHLGPDGRTRSPAQVMTLVNEELCRGNVTMTYVTAVIARMDMERGGLQWCNAGHNPPYLLRGPGSVEFLGGEHGKPLGVRRVTTYQDEQLVLGSEDGLFLYTDGVIDAADPRGEMFGEGRLDEVMGSNAFLPPRDLVEKVTAAVTAWLDGVTQPDDVTALVVRRAVAAESARQLTA